MRSQRGSSPNVYARSTSRSQSPRRRGCVRNMAATSMFTAFSFRSQSPRWRGCVRNALIQQHAKPEIDYVAIPSVAGMRSQHGGHRFRRGSLGNPSQSPRRRGCVRNQGKATPPASHGGVGRNPLGCGDAFATSVRRRGSMSMRRFCRRNPIGGGDAFATTTVHQMVRGIKRAPSQSPRGRGCVLQS